MPFFMFMDAAVENVSHIFIFNIVVIIISYFIFNLVVTIIGYNLRYCFEIPDSF